MLPQQRTAIVCLTLMLAISCLHIKIQLQDLQSQITDLAEKIATVECSPVFNAPEPPPAPDPDPQPTPL